MSRHKPLVSVLMPAYNCAPLIGRAIDAVLKQEHTDFEFLLINDGSTDATGDVIARYKDSRIRYFENSVNCGIVKTLNRGIELAQGKYIMRTDADDQSLPQMIARLAAFMEDNPLYAACGSSVKIMGTNTVVPKPGRDSEIKIYTLLSCPFPHTCVMIRKKTLDEHHLRYSVEFLDAEDHGLWSEMLLHGKFHNLKEVLIHYKKSNQGQVTAQPEYRKNYLASRNNLHIFQARNYFHLQEEDIPNYIHLMKWEKPDTYEGLARMNELLVQIREKNTLFDDRLLSVFLRNRWHHTCLGSYGYGRKVFSVFRNGIRTNKMGIKPLDFVQHAAKFITSPAG